MKAVSVISSPVKIALLVLSFAFSSSFCFAKDTNVCPNWYWKKLEGPQAQPIVRGSYGQPVPPTFLIGLNTYALRNNPVCLKKNKRNLNFLSWRDSVQTYSILAPGATLVDVYWDPGIDGVTPSPQVIQYAEKFPAARIVWMTNGDIGYDEMQNDEQDMLIIETI